MASLNDYSNNAKIKCPYFRMQYRTSIRCGGFLEEQDSTNLVFGTGKAKTDHINSFCTNGCWKGCALAILIAEREETNA